MLNLNNMPFLDMGEKPETYIMGKMEAFQTFIASKSIFPDKIIIKYSEYKSEFIKKNLR